MQWWGTTPVAFVSELYPQTAFFISAVLLSSLCLLRLSLYSVLPGASDFLKCTSGNLALGLNPSLSTLHRLSVMLRINLHPLVEPKIRRSDPTSSPASHTTPHPNPQITVCTHPAPSCPGDEAQVSPAVMAPALQAEGAACAKAPRPEAACCLFQDGETGGHSGPGHVGPWEGGEEGRLSSRRQEGC